MSAFPGLSLEDVNKITFAQGSELLGRARLRRMENDEALASMIVAKLAQAMSGKVEQIVKRPEIVDSDRPPRQLSEKDMAFLGQFMAKEPEKPAE